MAIKQPVTELIFGIDVGLARNSAGVIRVTDGGIGGLLTALANLGLITDSTAI